ncbi:hypothetical protein J6590_022414 [Homalodisca vitripennis]|nr:hypothetical protein J6590_022414 [Homalodisca vitripennis]
MFRVSGVGHLACPLVPVGQAVEGPRRASIPVGGPEGPSELHSHGGQTIEWELTKRLTTISLEWCSLESEKLERVLSPSVPIHSSALLTNRSAALLSLCVYISSRTPIGVVEPMDAASVFCCRKCLEILGANSHQECGGCCRKLHLTCSSLPGDEYYHLRRSPKLRWMCAICSNWVKIHQGGVAAAPAGPRTIYIAPEASTRTAAGMKRSKSNPNFEVIDSVSSVFDNILQKLKDLKASHINLDNHIEKLTSPDKQIVFFNDSSKGSGSETKKKVELSNFVGEDSTLVRIDNAKTTSKTYKDQTCQTSFRFSMKAESNECIVDKEESIIRLDEEKVLVSQSLMSLSCVNLAKCGDSDYDSIGDDVGDVTELNQSNCENPIADSLTKYIEHDQNSCEEHIELACGEKETSNPKLDIMDVNSGINSESMLHNKLENPNASEPVFITTVEILMTGEKNSEAVGETCLESAMVAQLQPAQLR